MPTIFNSGPVNIQLGNSAHFAVEFLDSNDELTVPLTGELTIVYPTTSGGTASATVTLTNNNSFFVGTWSSASAGLGTATWTVTADSDPTVQATGQLRIIQRQAT